MMKNKKNTKLIAVITLTVILAVLAQVFSIHKITSNKMTPTFKKDSVVLTRKIFAKERIRPGDVLIYNRKNLDDNLAVGRVIGSDTLAGYIGKGKFSSDGTAKISLLLPVICPEAPEDTANGGSDREICYEPLSLDDLKAIGYPVTGDNLSENTGKNGDLIVDAPAREEIKGKVIMCLTNCK